MKRLLLALLAQAGSAVLAADITLSPNTLFPQTEDDVFFIAKRQAAASARLATPAALASSDTVTSAANAAATITLAAPGADRRRRIVSVNWSTSGSATLPSAAAPATLTIAEGATVKYQTRITNPGRGFEFVPAAGWSFTANTAVTVSISAGGASVITDLNVGHAVE
jgi:hypothetical protein